MKKRIFILSTLLFSLVVNAQNLQETMRMAENQRYESAKSAFRKLVLSEPTNGNVYYYFGETYFNQGQGFSDTNLVRIYTDSANMMYQKGTEADPANPLNFVGLGKVLYYRRYETQAQALFAKALEMTKNKNATVMMKIAEAYINAYYKNLKAANELLAKALKLEPKNPEVHILMGDATLEADPMNGGPAVKKYNEAAALDPSSAKPILRIGKLYYRAKNATEALKWYKDAAKIDSTFAPAYIEMGELYLMANYNKKALESYKKYLALNNDLEARDRFAQILWVNKLHEEAVNEITSIQKTDSSSYTLYRLFAYSSAEVGDKFPPDGYNKGLYAIRKFFDMTANKKSFKYLASDYSTLGKLLSKTGQDSLAMAELKRALEMDTANKDINSDIGFANFKIKKYNEAIIYYSRKIDAGKPTVSDYVYLGISYYQTKQFALADSSFKKIIAVNPDYVLAYKYRAKSNAQLDPDSKLGLAKPYYEKVAELVLAKPENLEKGTNKKDIIEAYEYLGAYNLIVLKDVSKATEYFTKIKELDATNKKAIDYFKDLEKNKKP